MANIAVQRNSVDVGERPIAKFTVKCNSCGSESTKLTVDWSAHQEAAYCIVTVECLMCGIEEVAYESPNH